MYTYNWHSLSNARNFSMCYTPPCENSLSPSVLNASASTSPFIFSELIHSFDYNNQTDTCLMVSFTGQPGKLAPER